MLIEEATALDEAEDAALECGRQGVGIVGREARGLVEAHPVVDLGTDAVEDVYLTYA